MGGNGGDDGSGTDGGGGGGLARPRRQSSSLPEHGPMANGTSCGVNCCPLSETLSRTRPPVSGALAGGTMQLIVLACHALSTTLGAGCNVAGTFCSPKRHQCSAPNTPSP